ncbi:Cyclic peptide transporter [Candidatus Magnetomorum sp. HK-1]|nr:Cyclic peptide transporter [Candidatus Magnetomorum sp. HK-1]
MKFIKFLLDESPKEAGNIIVISIIYGIIAGLFAPLVMQATSGIIVDKAFIIWGFVLIVCVVLQLVTFAIAEYRTAKLMEQAIEKIILSIANNLRRDELQSFEKRNQSDIRLSFGEAQDISEGAIQSIRVLQSMISLLVIWFFIFTASALEGIIFLLLCGLILLLHELVRKLSKDEFIKIAENESRLLEVFKHFLNGFKEIKTDFQKSNDLFINYLKPIIKRIKQLRRKLSAINTSFDIFFSTSIFLLLALYVFVLPSQEFPETTMLIVVCILYSVKPSVIVIFSLPGIAMGESALFRLQQFTTEKNYISDFNENIYNSDEEFYHTLDSITLNDICFTYSESDGSPGFSVGPIKLTINAGEILFIAGGNGSGKSTLIKILMGLYPPTSGTITINGRQEELSEHRYLFSTVFSDFHLFEALYGIEKPDKNQIDHLLAQMQLDKKTSFDNGRFSTSDLSSGQRRRLALIEALAEDKKIYVFDEWAADQDPQFRNYFYENLLPSLKKQGKTVIVVTHDDRYYHLSDRVIFMKNGINITEKEPGKEDPLKKQNIISKPEVKPIFFHHETTRVTNKKDTKVKFLPVDKADDDTERRDLRDYTRSNLISLGLITLLKGGCFVIIIQIVFKSVSENNNAPEIRLFFTFFLLILLNIALQKSARGTISEVFENLSGAIRTRIIDRVRKIELSFFEKIGVERIQTSLTSDMKSMTDASITLIVSSEYLVRILFLSLYLAVLSFPVFFLGIVITGTIGLFYFWNQLQVKDAFERLRSEETAFFKAVTHLIDGFKELRLNDRKNDAFFNTHYKPLCSHIKSMRLKTQWYLMLNKMLVYGVWTLLMGMIPFMPLFIDIPKLTLFKCLGILAFLPINVLVFFISNITLGIESVRRLLKTIQTLDKAEQDIMADDSDKERVTFLNLCYQNLMFDYKGKNNDGQFCVGPINLSIQAGEIIYITGGNGSGKSTLIKLMTGLYKPVSGQILLNGRKENIRQYKYLFSAIFSDFHLFDRLYGITEINENRVNELIRLMKLNDKVEYTDGKFSTLNLSSGQKKRLALVIAMMEDRQVFIFDEWAAEQDPYFRRYFYETLLPAFKAQGKTVIAVTHHDQYFHLADRVVRMEYGQIID